MDGVDGWVGKGGLSQKGAEKKRERKKEGKKERKKREERGDEMEEERGGEVLIISKTIVQLRFYLDCRDSFQATLSLFLSFPPGGVRMVLSSSVILYGAVLIQSPTNKNCPITPGIPSPERE